MKPVEELIRMQGGMASGYEQMDAEAFEKLKADTYNREPGNTYDPSVYDCPICLNKGDIARAAQNDHGWWMTYHAPCKCLEIRKTIRQMQRSGLKNIIRDYTFSAFKATEPWQKTTKNAAMDYAKHPDGWFYIGGQVGCGKTHLCTAICREFLLNGREVKYMLWRDDAVKAKQLVNDYAEYQALIGPYKSAEVLYIDDLFKTGKNDKGETQRPTAADVNLAFEILNSRYTDPQKLTIISSECTVEELLAIDEGVGSRITERSVVFSISKDRKKNYRLRKVTEL